MKYTYLFLAMLFSFGGTAQTDTLLGLPLMPGDTGQVLTEAERMPLFPGCEALENGEADAYQQMKACADQQMLEFVYRTMKYPPEALAKKTEGTAIVSFIVEPDGRITSVRLVRGPGDGCGAEALRIVDLMAKEVAPWHPAVYKWDLVRVQFNLPIKFYTSRFAKDLSTPSDVLMGLPVMAGDTGKIYKVTQQMPLFPGCGDLGFYPERKRCAETKMIEFIYGNIEYPPEAIANGTEGMAVVSFIIERDGRVTSARIVRDPGDGCGAEAIRLVDMMAREEAPWNAGVQNGEAVRMQFNLPVKFKLD
jgi:TonB family protein